MVRPSPLPLLPATRARLAFLRSGDRGSLPGSLLVLGVVLGVAIAAPQADGRGAPARPPLLAAGVATPPVVVPVSVPSSPVAVSIPTVPGAASTAVAPDGDSVVCLDPGHGGSDVGAVRPDDGVLGELLEADLTLAYAQGLAERLTGAGFTVVLTRSSDATTNADGDDVNGDGETGEDGKTDQLDDLQARIQICNDANADLLVSLHFNAHENPVKRGYEAWYTAERTFGERNARFATLVEQTLGAHMGAAGYDGPSHGANPDSELFRPDENDTFAHLVLTGPAVPGKVEPSRMPGATVEGLFLSNDADAAFLTSAEGWDAILTGYQQAILAYFAEYPG